MSKPPVQSPIDASTRFCAVFGHPIRHSASPAMQNAGLAALGLNWRYLAFDVDPNHLKEAIAGAKRLGFIGINLTLPHKLLASDFMDALDESAAAFGAVNTIRFEGSRGRGQWSPLRQFDNAPPAAVRARGFNTDADAIALSLREDLKLRLRGASVLLLGAGGAGRTAAFKLASENIGSLYLFNRTTSKVAAVQRDLKKLYPSLKVLIGYPESEVDLIINATSLGLKAGDRLPLNQKKFSLRNARAVYDMIYRPAETPLLHAARAAGCLAANGLGMLLHQGARALEIWTGKPAPLLQMRRALEQNIYASS